MRRLCSGKTLAFQAKDAGSIPARRSNYTHKRSKVHAAQNEIKAILKAQTMNKVTLRVICKRSLQFNHLLFWYSDTNKFAGIVRRRYFHDLESKASKSSRLALSDEAIRWLNICLSCPQTHRVRLG